ncbi:BrnA antitoxin family protein [Chelatococcus sambhunathii]|uniref:BrnA antitoxin family protein n=1 Tax=Chelatococcus sambhunathii TaxID=363953 RepID=A0ABU1DIS4_9HYPH|nr:BrnA antitoxin family protein [Chelatococcus sambhunathii]MDR4308018.1 BrnA antitoxin family protein [Chelatococcus sambhunathii]
MTRKPARSFPISTESQKRAAPAPIGTGRREDLRKGPHTAAEDPDDGPEWTDAQLARAELAENGDVIRPASGTLKRGPGRPRIANPKKQVSVRLDPDVIDALQKGGPGWQGRMNEALRKALKLG